MMMILLVSSNLSGTVLYCSEVEQYRGRRRGKESPALQRTWKWRHHLALKKACDFVELSTTVWTTSHSDWKGLNHYTQIVLLPCLEGGNVVHCVVSFLMHTHKFNSYNDHRQQEDLLMQGQLPQHSLPDLGSCKGHNFTHLTVGSGWASGD